MLIVYLQDVAGRRGWRCDCQYCVRSMRNVLLLVAWIVCGDGQTKADLTRSHSDAVNSGVPHSLILFGVAAAP